MTRSGPSVQTVVVSVLPRSTWVAVIVVSFCLLLLVLEIMEVGVQPFEALLPMSSVLAHPIGHVAQRLGGEPARAPFRLPALVDVSGPLRERVGVCDGREWHVNVGR